MEPVDPRDLRISDADRHRVAEVLREAAGEGRLDLDELDERLEATYAAKTYGDLVPITVDLPGTPAAPRRARRPARRSPRRAAVPAWPAADLEQLAGDHERDQARRRLGRRRARTSPPR